MCVAFLLVLSKFLCSNLLLFGWHGMKENKNRKRANNRRRLAPGGPNPSYIFLFRSLHDIALPPARRQGRELKVLHGLREFGAGEG